MKSFLIFVGGIVVGFALFAFLGTGIMTGIGAGVGIATGLKAGACVTVEAAKEQGLISSGQVEEVLNAAVAKITRDAGDADTRLVGSDAECHKIVDEWLQLAASGT